MNEREIATVVLFGTLVVLGLINQKSRVELVGGFAQLAKAFWNRKVIGVLLVYAAWVALCVWVAHLVGFWRPSLLKDMLLTAVVVGFPLLMRSLKNKNGTLLLRDIAKEAVGLSALVGFYVNLTPLPLWLEIALQFVLFVLLMSQVAVRRIDGKPGQRLMSGCISVLLALIGIGVFIWSTVRFVAQWPELDQTELFLQLAQSVWLPLALFPFLYGFAYMAAVEGIFVRLPYMNGEVSVREKLGILVGLGFSLRSAKAFTGRHMKLNGPRTFAGAVEHARNIGHDLDQREARRRDQLDSLAANAGLVGADAGGAQLDRREFHVTKEALRWLHTCQSGWFERQGDRFWGPERLDSMLNAAHKKELPDAHGITLETNRDRTKWRAWRELPNGWVLGIGSTKRSDQYLYAGPNAPHTFPGESDE